MNHTCNILIEKVLEVRFCLNQVRLVINIIHCISLFFLHEALKMKKKYQ
jgi:hypothetical protein